MREELYNGVPFCDLSAFDKEKVNQGILEADEVTSTLTIHSARVNSFVVVETDRGDFRVWRNGSIDQWKDYDGASEWGYFDELDFEPEDVEALRAAASAARVEAWK